MLEEPRQGTVTPPQLTIQGVGARRACGRPLVPPRGSTHLKGGDRQKAATGPGACIDLFTEFINVFLDSTDCFDELHMYRFID